MESCSQRELKEHFSSFAEDYNTATMPSEKYYNMRKWYLEGASAGVEHKHVVHAACVSNSDPACALEPSQILNM